jgi:hypothetical protein
MVSERVEEGLVAPLELSDGVIEQVEAMAKELKKISEGIWILVEGVGKLTEVVEGMKKKEVERVDKEVEMEDVWKVDKQTETEVVEKEESEEEEDNEKEESGGEKEDDKEEDRNKEMDGNEKIEKDGEEEN